MADPTSDPLLNNVFPEPLRKRIFSALGSTPQHLSLFQDIAIWAQDLQHRQGDADGPAAKKRKLVNGTAAAESNGIAENTAPPTRGVGVGPLELSITDVSFSMPVRKKLTLETTGAGPDGDGVVVRGRNQVSGEVEFEIGRGDIEHVFLLPVPEKAQKQSNCIILPRPSATPAEPILFTLPSAAAKNASLGPNHAPLFSIASETEPPSYEDALLRTMNPHITVTQPTDAEFVSTLRESHRKTEPAYHVKAFRGSKEGYLFFLSTGILFGFKKPLLFFPFENINSISYTSVLQRTFNLNIAVSTPGPTDAEEEEEFEFSMLDQADFSGIDTYIKRHGLNDASMAASRRAKKLNVNPPASDANGATAPDGEGEAEMTELEKAQQELEDAEDEEEEDYDPGSEGDSDGSGSGNDEDEEEERVGGGDADADEEEEGDLVQEELGSEAESVVWTDEEGVEEEEEEDDDDVE